MNSAFTLVGSLIQFSSESSSTNYVLDIPPQTNREVYYSVTYLLPNWTEDGSDYEDVRFLSSNAMTSPLLEDNTPPNDVTTVEALFNPLENGTGYTTIAWDGLFSEENEVYKIYRHGEYFSSTNDPYAQLIATVAEAADTDGDGSFVFYYNVPYNTFGNFIYCVVVVDQYGAYNTDISSNSCDDVDEDSDETVATLVTSGLSGMNKLSAFARVIWKLVCHTLI